MSTTVVNSWIGADLSQIGPIYPFVGSEFLLVIIGVACWLIWHVLQMRIESREMKEDAEAAQSKERMKSILEREARQAKLY